MTYDTYSQSISQMHARYNYKEEIDEYAGHRTVQAFSLSQFVKLTSTTCDAVVAVGDFNTRPSEIAYEVVRANAMLDDAWLSKVYDTGYLNLKYVCDRYFLFRETETAIVDIN